MGFTVIRFFKVWPEERLGLLLFPLEMIFTKSLAALG